MAFRLNMNLKRVCLWILLCSCCSVQANSRLDRYVIDLVNTKVTPQISQLKTSASLLHDMTLAQCRNHPKIALNELQNQWRITHLHWKRVNLFGFGPMGKLRIERHVDFWPTRVTKLNQLLQSDQYQQQYAVAGVSVKGFPALEWLLYQADHNDPNWCTLIQALSKELTEHFNRLEQEWRKEFDLLTASQTDKIKLSQFIYSEVLAEEFLNAAVVGLYAIRKKGLITPMGLTTGYTDTQRIETINSGQAVQTFLTRMNTAIELFEDEQTGLVPWLVKHGDAKLANQISTKLHAIKQLIPSAGNHFVKMVEQQDQQLVDLESHMNDLQFILETDMPDNFELIMFFKDLDGD